MKNNDLKVLYITNMYPSKNHPYFGIFVKEGIESISKYYKVKPLLVMNQIKLNTFFILIYKYSILSLKAIASIFRSFDLIHAHYAFPPGFLGVVVKKITHKPLILTVHGSDINKLAKKGILSKFVKYSLSNADRIIAVGSGLRSTIEHKFNIPPYKIIIIPTSVDLELFKPIDKEMVRHKLNLSDKKRILFVGNLEPVKNPLLFVELAKRLPKYDFVLVGGGSLKHKMIELKERFHLSNLKLAGSVKKVSIPLYMNASDLLILPSKSEGFGLVLVEAMACGLPVLGTKVGGIKDIIKDDINGYFISNVEDAVKKINMLLKDKSLYSKTSKQAIKSSKYFSSKNYAEKNFNLYKKFSTTIYYKKSQ